MPEFATEFALVDLTQRPPAVSLPRHYNAAHDFVDRHLTEGRGDKLAIIDDGGQYSYAEVAERVNRAGNMLRALGVGMEQRVFLCLLDSIDFVACFFGAIKIGAVPVPVNTLLTSADYAYMLGDSRAGVLVVSDVLLEKFTPLIADQAQLEHVLVSGDGVEHGHSRLAALLAAAESALEPAATTADDVGFWLYSSGSTGAPKGAVHLQSDAVQTAALYGSAVLGIVEDDVVFSAAKLFFAYGLGNALTFPFHVGATAVLMAERPTPESVMARLKRHDPTIFYGVPTLYGAILADQGLDKGASSQRLRRCVSAGEALPEDIAKRWVERFGIDILDGIGSTEMLHIFLSNAPDDFSYGTTGKAVPGYELRIVDEDDQPVAAGELGELLVRGPSSATAYFNNRAKSLATFQGPWTRTGDKYLQDEAGYYVYGGRSDDMLKVGGIWVSPFEVESALMAHDQVLEAAVVGQPDADDLIKPKAFVVPTEGSNGSPELADEIKAFVKDRLAPYKYPRWVEFADELPKTATGKIQRFKLRGN
ncbi:MAG TPA: benzoate-CoA ligase family protein [Alphaproteobacteria bacterium]|jgi:4-hydroxybenzoate-CoA ligase/benzoate-CoA ligase|nr:benzoate-CoA ligase family protein [Alphaproteobacteria bacterium]MDP6269075.1 benzoate-CoA ligase family protein [Alphaproteobacteria bacterium]MDP7164848.1 benzoate-CoA ligase family protein [Alphaproteobacteria bacterium]HJM51919.1 benzoate-CoA ligase family protein [Alphaproteobacteria bacterium]